MSDLDAAQVLADYADALDRRGLMIEIGRVTGTNPSSTFRAKCRARARGNRPEQLIGSTQQGEVTIKAFYPDLVENRFPLPVRTTDHVVLNGKQLQISAVDERTGRVGNTRIFVKISAVG
jgi:hypothetical protein